MEELGDQYCLIGPYNEACVRTEVEVIEPYNEAMQKTLQQMRDHGIKVNWGCWMVKIKTAYSLLFSDIYCAIMKCSMLFVLYFCCTFYQIKWWLLGDLNIRLFWRWYMDAGWLTVTRRYCCLTSSLLHGSWTSGSVNCGTWLTSASRGMIVSPTMLPSLASWPHGSFQR